jgi:hypothetical protein
LFLPFSAYPKPRTAFLEEREDDEDLSMEYDDSTYLSWKEILSLTNNYDKVNSFLIEENVLISPNYILPKSKVLCCILVDIASGRTGRTTIERQVEIKST